ncbi:bcs1 [Metarhizium album ARSEF 1941]|uniref:Bcs1 n=1 Tax=Metarhizium album (strain ARSEF 1941) TaxID=1081103 RepID=A0A0B2WZN3_METAS|nr:bcs1 [Metarhizium album ARSEF 1941]KHN99049.1 bcs1 [Metarhizium album ARSEF 1941]
MDVFDQAKQALEAGEQAHQPTPRQDETDVPGAPSPQFAILNYLFPGYSMVISAAHAYVGVDFNSYVHFLIIIIAAAMAWNYIKDQLWVFFRDYFMSSVTIHTDDEIYNMVMLWLSKQKFSHNSRHFVANTNINSRHRFMYNFNRPDSDDENDQVSEAAVDVITGLSNDLKQALHYTPSFGMHFFWYKLRPLSFERLKNRDQMAGMNASEKEELRISCLGRNPNILKELLLEARQMHMKKDDRKTVIYRANLNETCWQRCMSRLNRPFSTVILNDHVKQDLIADAADYLNPVTRRWYANRGIPYRRGYLLHGPPGTGKSSLSLALAGYFRMKIYIVSLSSTAATEEKLTSLFHELPTQCVVLLEDIDSAGLTHTRDDSAAPTTARGQAASPVITSANGTGPDTPLPEHGRVSLSGLLNILDGVASQEGRILIMTTNHIEKLDKALIRPGRVDSVIPFGLADSRMTSAIFRSIYAPYENETSSKADAKDPDQGAMQARLAQKHAQISKRVDELSRQFAEKIPENEFSPAEVQGLLLRYKRDPEGALAASDAWVEQMRKDRRLGVDETEKKTLEEGKTKQEEKDGDGNTKDKNGQEENRTPDEASLAPGKPDGPKKNISDSGYETP